MIRRAGNRPGTESRPRDLRVEPGRVPWCARRLATEFDPVVQPVRPVVPELDDERQQTIAGPLRRPWNGPQREPGGVERDRLLQGVAAFERRRLRARPGADLGEPR